MSPLMIPLFALLIPILAIIGGVFMKPWLAHKERQLELQSTMAAEKAAQYAAHVERLEQRVRVLERIATDSGVPLLEEIERLRDDRPVN